MENYYFDIMPIGVIFSVAVYLIPTQVAVRRIHHNWLAITILNLFLGWTFLGWVAALVWACTESRLAVAPERERAAFQARLVSVSTAVMLPLLLVTTLFLAVRVINVHKSELGYLILAFPLMFAVLMVMEIYRVYPLGLYFALVKLGSPSAPGWEELIYTIKDWLHCAEAPMFSGDLWLPLYAYRECEYTEKDRFSDYELCLDIQDDRLTGKRPSRESGQIHIRKLADERVLRRLVGLLKRDLVRHRALIGWCWDQNRRWPGLKDALNESKQKIQDYLYKVERLIVEATSEDRARVEAERILEERARAERNNGNNASPSG